MVGSDESDFNCEEQSHKRRVLKRKETESGESNRRYPLTSTQLGQTGSHLCDIEESEDQTKTHAHTSIL